MKIVKQTITENQINLGGKPEDITPLHYSCYNFNNNFNSELIEMSPDFHYFSVSPSDYVHARSRNLHFNWKYENLDGDFGARYRRTKMVRKICELQSKMELAGYKEENFIPNNQDFAPYIYSFGIIPEDDAAEKEIQTKESPKVEEKIEIIVV